MEKSATPAAEPDPAPTSSERAKLTEDAPGATWTDTSEDALCEGLKLFGTAWIARQLRESQSDADVDWNYAAQLGEEKCEDDWLVGTVVAEHGGLDESGVDWGHRYLPYALTEMRSPESGMLPAACQSMRGALAQFMGDPGLQQPFRVDALECDRAVVDRVVPALDGPHPAFAEFTLEFIAPGNLLCWHCVGSRPPSRPVREQGWSVPDAPSGALFVVVPARAGVRPGHFAGGIRASARRCHQHFPGSWLR
ncbi:hypothetical protein OHB04_08265 [Streptomyces sp. NBC_01775]|uniref:hypothetical protein n=1 Tax=Streptomyces sp. NBC_01775 TaxID=2975939 RepID=UPI002DD9419C|nr:hypothetical protein [Streptomyces sp. NBC_01775]WSB75782.1 hypothetical protein OHB04_08265 [Streptomyces sp. NBC_01775]